MKESELAGYIFQHDARNLQLKRRLAERGVDWRTLCQITCRFGAASRQQASDMAQELSRRGFSEIRMIAPRGQQAGQSWRLEARLRGSIDRVASHEFTEEMVRSAAALSCFYEGWETRLAPEPPSSLPQVS